MQDLEDTDLLEILSPELREFIEAKLDSLEDDDVQSLCRTFMPFPAPERKSSHPDTDEWFVLPQYLSHLPHSKNPIGEGLRMFDWQEIVFAELAYRGLGHAEFWSKEQISKHRKQYIESSLKGKSFEVPDSTFYHHSQVCDEGPLEISMDPDEMDEFFQKE